MGALNGSDRRPANLTDSQSWNRYRYAGGDPVNFADPSGNLRVAIDNPNHCFGTLEAEFERLEEYISGYKPSKGSRSGNTISVNVEAILAWREIL